MQQSHSLKDRKKECANVMMMLRMMICLLFIRSYDTDGETVKHGRPGIGATHSSRFISLKVP
jgi:hypothetical protein